MENTYIYVIDPVKLMAVECSTTRWCVVNVCRLSRSQVRQGQCQFLWLRMTLCILLFHASSVSATNFVHDALNWLGCLSCLFICALLYIEQIL